MKAIKFTLGAAAVAAAQAMSASGATYYAKFRADAKDNLYAVGAKAVVEASVADKSGKTLKKGTVDVWADDGWTNVVWRRTVDLAKEPVVRMELSRSTPGSLRLRIKGNGMQIKAGMDRIIFGVKSIEPLTPCPPDFESYWRGELARLEREIPIAVGKTPAPNLDTADHKAYYVSFATFNGGRIYGLLCVPKGEGRFPAMVNVPGAGPGTTTIFPSKLQLVRKGWITLLMNIHGIPLTGTDAEYHARYKKWFDDYAAKAGEPRYQYVGYAESREAPIYHRDILGMTRAIDWLAKEPYADPSRFVYYGCSQGGGFGLYLTAMWGRFAKSLILCPNKCDMLAYLGGREPGSSHIMNQKPEKIRAAEKTAPYHDNCNFARMIKTPVRMVYGTADDNCQTVGGIAAFNVIASKDKGLKLVPGKGHGWITAGFDEWLFSLPEPRKPSALRAKIEKRCRITKEDVWYGFRRTVFDFNGHSAWIVEPDVEPAAGSPWTWTMQWATAFVDRTGVPDLLKVGWRHVTIETYRHKMDDEGLRVSREFQRFLVDDLGFAPKANLIGMSWGGFFSVRYANAYPDCVAKIYLDAPLLCFDGFLDRFGKTKAEIGKIVGPWAESIPEGGKWSGDPRMPVNMAPSVAKAGIPILLLYGGKDVVVPPKTSCEPFIERFKAAGGNISVTCRPTYGHHPHGEDKGRTVLIRDFFAGK